MKLFLILFLAVINFTFAQRKTYKGIIKDDYKNKLHNVQISLNNSIQNLVTDCNGKFEFLGKIGDTIKISKKGFKTRQIVLRKKRRIKIDLAYDIEYIKSIFDTKYSNDSEDRCYCQPIFLVNGIPETEIDVSKKLEKKHIKNVKVIKGLETKPYGKYAVSGIIFITTTCDYE